MNYQVYLPSRELQNFVKCFWSLEDDGRSKPQKQRVVPDGCMEMIFHFGDRYRQYFNNGSSYIQPRSFIFGQITHYLEIEPTGVTGIIAARFLPEGLQPLLPVPVSSLQDRAIVLSDIFGEQAIQLEQALLTSGNIPQRIQLIESFLISKQTQPTRADTIIANCVEVIMRSQGKIGVADLAQQMKTTRRQLERRFASSVGMSPKRLARAVRLQAALRMLEQKKFDSLTDLAYENGYYDQAHFIRDFKEFTGTSPKSFYAGNLRFATLFAEAD